MKKRGFTPLHLLLLGLLTMAALRWLVPGPRFGGLATILVGAVLVIGGTVLGVVGERRFQRAGTSVRPGTEASVLVTTGPYRFTRNPMYLGGVMLALGVALLLGAVLSLAIPLLMLLVLDRFVAREERYLGQRFGPQYADYRARVRRWI